MIKFTQCPDPDWKRFLYHKCLWKQGSLARIYLKMFTNFFLPNFCAEKCMAQNFRQAPNTSYLTLNCILAATTAAGQFPASQFGSACVNIYYKHMAVGSQWWRGIGNDDGNEKCKNLLTNKHAARDSKSSSGNAKFRGRTTVENIVYTLHWFLKTVTNVFFIWSI